MSASATTHVRKGIYAEQGHQFMGYVVRSLSSSISALGLLGLRPHSPPGQGIPLSRLPGAASMSAGLVVSSRAPQTPTKVDLWQATIIL